MSKPELYQLTLSSGSMRLVARALDLWDRTLGGQFTDLKYELINLAPPQNRDRIEVLLAELRQLVFPQLGPGAGDFTFPGGQLAFNLRKVIEHAVSWREQPPEQDKVFLTVNYDGPMAGWWEGEVPAKALVYEGDDAVRIRDEVNRKTKLWGAFAELVGTEDVADATKLVLTWKAAYENACTGLAPTLGVQPKHSG